MLSDRQTEIWVHGHACKMRIVVISQSNDVCATHGDLGAWGWLRNVQSCVQATCCLTDRPRSGCMGMPAEGKQMFQSMFAQNMASKDGERFAMGPHAL